MTHWKFTKLPCSPIIKIFKKSENRKMVFLGESLDIHSALTEVSSYFRQGDLIETPEGSCLMHGICGEPNN